MSLKNSNRYDLLNIQYPSLFELYQKQKQAFWIPEEVDLSDDVLDWKNLQQNEKDFLLYILAFFAQADGLVLENLRSNFSLDIPIPEASAFYGIQAGIEAIHWEMYSLLIQTFIKDPEVQRQYSDAIRHFSCIRKKAEWMSTWMNNERPLAERLIAFCCAEGISFSASFCGIFYFKKKGLMQNLVLSNQFISRDEGIHRDFGIEVIRVLRESTPDTANPELNDIIREVHALTPERITEIVKECVQVEETYVRESLQCDLVDIDSTMMVQYVQFVADHLLSSLDVPKYYKVSNPFDWMDMISLEGKQNFFEGRVSEYKKVNAEKIEFDELGSDDF